MSRRSSNYGSFNSNRLSPEVVNPNSPNHMQYEEIEAFVQCPTCKGAGRIPKDTEAEYVALIPLTDKRLKPRRTMRYVCITLLVCAVLVALLLIFLIPRSISLKSDAPYITPRLTKLEPFPGFARIFMALTNTVNLTNGNYYAITVTEIRMTVTMAHYVVKDVVSKQHIGVGALQRKELYINANITLDNPSLKTTSYCTFDDYILRTLYMTFAFTVTASYMNQNTEATLRTTQGVDCFPTANKTTGTPSYEYES